MAMIEHAFRIGRYRCVASYDGPVPVRDDGSATVLRTDFEWAPDVPDWSRFTAAERQAYAAEADAFLAKVMKAGVH
jgi:hypothetical protein